MADFKLAYAITARHEGGYANSPHDTGGETMLGVSRNNFANWEGWEIVDALKRQPGFPGTANSNAALKTLAAAFYKGTFWDVFRLDTVKHQGIANELFDTAVNMGVSRAAQFLQRAINVTNNRGQYTVDIQQDGKVGPATINALNKHAYPEMVLKVLNVLQGEFYVRLAERNPTQEIFMRSWLSRVSLALVGLVLCASCTVYPPTQAGTISKKGMPTVRDQHPEKRHF
ncbi:glycoside hydrolase family 108 protein [Hymenobacter sp. AT01-02]|uniref:glycoside hydrolase family 108 protein n=1 Tax=Hymenobacter sp. AT01-02 TaxID=1571877 RepID=UPI00092FB3B1|nr:glycosyl hydrolase 108 family protein [Hymenobacter sp. AT01-02]